VRPIRKSGGKVYEGVRMTKVVKVKKGAKLKAQSAKDTNLTAAGI
jgi:hypothetical protein